MAGSIIAGDITADTWKNSNGTENYKCRAWVNFNGTGTVAIRASGNVSSVTDLGTGQYTVNFTTPMPDASYSASGACDKGDSNDDGNMMVGFGGDYQSYSTKWTTSSLAVWTIVGSSTAKTDCKNVSIQVFR